MRSTNDRFLPTLFFRESDARKLIITGFLVCFAFVSFSHTVICGAKSASPKKAKIRSYFKDLPIPKEKREFFVKRFHRARQDNLLAFEGPVGVKALLNTLGSVNIPSNKMVNLLDVFGDAVGRNLPVYMITSTSIRLLHKGASIDIVIKRVREELYTIQKISDFVRRQGLKLTEKQWPILINALAESVELFVGKAMASSEVALSDREKLRQTVYNSINYTGLPVNFASGSGIKGSSETEGGSNTALSGFLKSSKTLGRLSNLALEIKDRRK